MQRHTLLQYIQRRQQFTRRMLPRLHVTNQGVMNHAPTEPLYFAPPVPYPVVEDDFLRSQTPAYEIQEINEPNETQSLPTIDISYLPDQSQETNFSSAPVGTDVSRPLPDGEHSQPDVSRPHPDMNIIQEKPGHGHGEPVPTPSANFSPNDLVGTDSSRPRPRRARIEEQPSRPPQPLADASTSPTSSPTQSKQQAHMAQRKTNAQPPTTPDHKISKAQAEADALFTSAPARSPQEWLAKLMQSENKDAPSPQNAQNAHPVRNDIGYSRGGSGEDVGGGPLRSPVVLENAESYPLSSPIVSSQETDRAKASAQNKEAQLSATPKQGMQRTTQSSLPPTPVSVNSAGSRQKTRSEQQEQASTVASARIEEQDHIPAQEPSQPFISSPSASNIQTTSDEQKEPAIIQNPQMVVKSPITSRQQDQQDKNSVVQQPAIHQQPSSSEDNKQHIAVGADVSHPLANAPDEPDLPDSPGELLSQHAQQFLRPVVGIDPTSVRIHRDASAAQFAAAHQADAVTTGNDIMLATGHAEDTPQTLALLAHEMTHVARQRAPRFVPPIISTQAGRSQGITPTMMDEEGLALQVEQQAFYHAQHQTQQPIHAQEPRYRAGADQQDQPTSVTNELVTPVARSSRSMDDWGGLPAPWEPLPDWLTTTFTAEGHRSATSTTATMPIQPIPAQMAPVQFTAPLQPPATHGNSHGDRTTSSTASNTGVAGDVQRAGIERSINTAQQIDSVQQMAGVAQAPEPDLDDLARQVYAVLKRRLGVEHRRL